MYNRKKMKKAQIEPYEKYLRNNNLGPKANDEQKIAEGEWTDHVGNLDKVTITEEQMKDAQIVSDNKESKVLEKVLNSTKEYLSIPHRDASVQLSMPPMNVLVEKLRQDRLPDFRADESQEQSWTLAYDGQNGSLPSWKKNYNQVKPEQTNLQNDPSRFDEIKADNMVKGKNKNKLTPVTASLNRGDLDCVVNSIKLGHSLDYDAAIVAILKQADIEKRELTPIEQKTVSNLKISRTRAMLPK